MDNYNEFKRFVVGLVRGKINENNDIVSYLLGRHDPENEVVIYDKDVKEFYNLSRGVTGENVEIFSDKSYEIGCFVENPLWVFSGDYPIVIEDKINKLKYKLGCPSLEYASFIVSLMAKKFVEEKKKHTASSMMLLRYLRTVDRGGEFSPQKLFSWMVGIFSIQIESEENKKIEEFREYKSSIEFHLMYKGNTPVVSINKIDDLKNEIGDSYNLDLNGIDEPPLRKYDSNVMDYYKVALSSESPYIKYISFYHVIEYYYEEVFRKNIINAIRGKITSPLFSYKNDDNIYEIASFVKNRIKYHDESGQGNEKDSLEYVLKEYVNIDDLQKRIVELNHKAVDFYNNTQVVFCNGHAIHWKNEQEVYKNISNRIYATRNSLIHSKSGRGRARYKPYDHEKILQKEIPLIRAIAELVIINSSEII